MPTRLSLKSARFLTIGISWFASSCFQMVGMAHHLEAHAGLAPVRSGIGFYVRYVRAECEHDGGRGEGSDQLNVNPIECRER